MRRPRLAPPARFVHRAGRVLACLAVAGVLSGAPVAAQSTPEVPGSLFSRVYDSMSHHPFLWLMGVIVTGVIAASLLLGRPRWFQVVRWFQVGWTSVTGRDTGDTPAAAPGQPVAKEELLRGAVEEGGVPLENAIPPAIETGDGHASRAPVPDARRMDAGDAAEPGEEGVDQRREFEQRVEGQLAAMERRSSEVTAQMKTLAAELEALKTSTKERQAQLTRAQERIAEVERRSLELYFDAWKSDHLRREREKQLDFVRREAASDPGNVRLLAECRESCQDLIAAATPWFQAMESWAKLLAGVGRSDASWRAAFDAFLARLKNYIAKGNDFVSGLEAQVDGEVAADDVSVAPVEVTFSDVVWGRSASLLDGGFRQRLSSEYADLRNRADSLAGAWDKLRKEVLTLLDDYHEVMSRMDGEDGRTAAVVADGVRQAWRTARLEEIRIEQGSTLFNPGVHEALNTQPRTDMPDKTIVRIERPGFYCDSKVFRRALVVVSTAEAARVF